jgi:hypothetical protein
MRRCWWRFVFVAAGLLMAVRLAQAAEAPTYSYRSLFTLGGKLPGDLVTENDMEVTALNNAGTVLFVADVGNGEAATVIEPDGSMTVVFQPGKPAPTGGNFDLIGIENPFGLNDAGNIVMSADVDRGNGATKEVLFFDKAANKWTTVMKAGMPVPGGGTFQAAFKGSFINNANDIAFDAQITESSAGPKGVGVFLWSAGNVTVVARPGTKVASGTLTEARRMQISANGIVTFEGAVDGVAGYGAYMWKNGVITELATSNISAPGKNEKLASIRGPVANANGDVAMLGLLNSSGWGAYLYSATEKTLISVAQPGDPLPAGGILGSAEAIGRNSIRIGEDGSVLFAGGHTNADGGVYLWKDGKISVVARTGQELKGIGKPDNLANNGLNSWGLGYNQQGQILFPVKVGDKEQLVLATPLAAPTTP